MVKRLTLQFQEQKTVILALDQGPNRAQNLKLVPYVMAQVNRKLFRIHRLVVWLTVVHVVTAVVKDKLSRINVQPAAVAVR
ncbi:hypothetical protein D3C78_1431060 [compost metagenome]